jgi:hypothetical protein
MADCLVKRLKPRATSSTSPTSIDGARGKGFDSITAQGSIRRSVRSFGAWLNASVEPV